MGSYLLAYPVRALALAAPLVMATGGFAQAACYGSRQQLPTQTLAQFMANPGQLQSRYPTGGARMISMVRDLVASNPAMLPRVLDLSASSNADQINAIGTGLGQAALVCSRGDPAFANEIQQMVAAVNVQPLAVTFAAVTGNSPAPAAVPAARGAPSGANAGNASGSTVNPTSPANPVTGQPGNPFIAPPGSPVTAGLNPSGTTPVGANATGGTSPGVTSSPTSPGTTAPQGETSALGIPTSTTGSTGVTGSTGTTTTSTTATTSVPGSLATTSTGTTATITTGATTTGTTNSPAALTTVAGSVTTLTGAPTTNAVNSTGVPGELATLPIGTTATGAPSGISRPTTSTGAPSGISSTTPISSSIGTTATSSTGSTSTTSAVGTSATSATGTTTGFVGGSLTLNQRAVAPTSFFTLDFTASGQPVTGGTKGTWRSVSPSQ